MDEINLRTLSARFDSLIHPPPRGFGKIFSYISIALAAGLFLFIMLVSTPWLSEWWGCAIASHIKSRIPRETAKQLCDSAVLILQILLILSIGGVVFTESLSKNIGRFIDQFQSVALDALEKNDLKRREAFIASIEKIQELETSKNYKEFFREAIRIMGNVSSDIPNLPNRYARYIARGIVFNFPGRMYGFIAFELLFFQVCALSTKIVLDYLPAGCQW
jgi:uncharacterized membrane protein required for colicin V production